MILATGAGADSTLLREFSVETDEKGYPVLDENLQTTKKGVYVAGDAAFGPRTVVEAISDAARISAAITGASFDRYEDANRGSSADEYLAKKGELCPDVEQMPDERCLGCETVCGVCADVCPNRANILVNLPEGYQILHVDGRCNECGNCAIFCPYDASPYLDKFTVFETLEDFEDSENTGFLMKDENNILLRTGEEIREIDIGKETELDHRMLSLIRYWKNEKS